MYIKIAASILSANRKALQKEVDEIEPYSDLIHIDVMDGKFVPPITFTSDEIKAIKTKLPKDVHLMVEHPLKDGFINDYIDAGAKSITIHEEAKDDVLECINYLKKNGVKASLSIKPATPLEKLLPYLKYLDMVLIMSVNPGYSGQKFMPEILKKVKKLRKLKPLLDIEIDGGINKGNIKLATDAGANIFVVGSSIFNQKDKIKAILELRNAVK